jgi:uncharacterized protein YprB with RNaseH-like and TPR domain
MASTYESYLDIETDWQRRLTVIGWHAPASGTVQLVGPEITAARLAQALPDGGVLYTYNGHCFDLVCIRQQLGIDLRRRFESCDLRWVCQRHGLRGGQKRIEQRIGVQRALPGLDGLEAIALWTRYQHGDAHALAMLLHYNAEDLSGLVAIKRHLVEGGLLARTGGDGIPSKE